MKEELEILQMTWCFGGMIFGFWVYLILKWYFEDPDTDEDNER